MNRRQKNQDQRAQKVVAVLNDHPDELLTIPAMADAAAELRRRVGLVQPAVSQQLQGRQGKGATQTKNDLEAPLIRQTVKVANALNLYYRKAGSLDLAMALHLRPSDYDKMAQPALATETQDVADQLAEHIKDLAYYGFKPAAKGTPGNDETFQAQVTAYEASLPGNRTAQGKGKVGTSTVRTVFQDLRTYLLGDFRSAVELLVDDHHELYLLLREAMNIDDLGKGGRKKKGGDAPKGA